MGVMASRVVDLDLDISLATVLTAADYGIPGPTPGVADTTLYDVDLCLGKDQQLSLAAPEAATTMSPGPVNPLAFVSCVQPATPVLPGLKLYDDTPPKLRKADRATVWVQQDEVKSGLLALDAGSDHDCSTDSLYQTDSPYLTDHSDGRSECDDESAAWLTQVQDVQDARRAEEEAAPDEEWWAVEEQPLSDVAQAEEEDDGCYQSQEQPTSSSAAVEEFQSASSLFGRMGGASRIAFAIDVSGSMAADVNCVGMHSLHLPPPGGQDRMGVVKQHLKRVLQSMEHVEGAAFGIAVFNNRATALFDGRLLPATKDNISKAMAAIDSYLSPGGGNGAEAACLAECLKMAPDPCCTRLRADDRAEAVYFLGDGGWDAQPLVEAARQHAGECVIHSINFFSSGGGLEEIANITGGTYLEIKSMADVGEC